MCPGLDLVIARESSGSSHNVPWLGTGSCTSAVSPGCLFLRRPELGWQSQSISPQGMWHVHAAGVALQTTWIH